MSSAEESWSRRLYFGRWLLVEDHSYGLSIDTVKSFTLALHNGTITKVDNSRPEMFFALPGGLNKFGVVAGAELFTHAQVPLIYGGTRLYAGSQVDRIINATSKFEGTNTDPKATVITSVLGSGLGATATTQFFYDGPSKPASFAVFDGISTLLIDSVKTQSFSDFVASIPSDIRDPTNFRGTWETLSTTRTTLKFMQALKTEAERLGRLPRAPTGVSLAVDAYIPGMSGKHAVGSTAFPHADSQFPVLLDVAWMFSKDDKFWRDQVRQSRNRLRDVASAEGILHPTSYANYSQGDISAEELWGAANAARLRRIRDEVDPSRVMELTGGFRL
ncbi:Putative berberine/berberine, FAD-binding, type PCMH, subdomain 2 [Septoria linicola]|uniref:Berberine/berberine, FAD-binding, type PCMH, subdomain 2 n=1 Tax=Septoria linicola TaxID=215465 RepID=A0A9Q9ESG3_9PEZI|nr:Putative berberine/berberine, FAD-binding, type PCMH, subdomain 2 [Septoria linicola]